ncbi:MAG: TIGR01459 family HAD-type hydrolase [Alphaproteobacteria bacterium]|nr:MAG: TIGR01459 family HAD-type hydrolase [Alphaproteobacteria bacterium]
MSVVLPSFTPHFATLAGDYDVVLCDVWGVVHNGVAAAADAGDALARFRERGGTVVLITNAPRPGERVARLTLDRLGVPRAAYDGIVSSGDVTRALIAARAGARVFHIGPERDVALFETVETPHDYRDVIARMRARSLPMICANPDVVVERGDKLVYCAGAIADPYAAAGGEVIYAGKPYRPIYEQALALAEAARGRPVKHHRLLAIGDSVRTDLKGADAFGIDCLFVTAGIHAEELGSRHDPDAAALAGIFAAAGVAPKAVMHRLSW